MKIKVYTCITNAKDRINAQPVDDHADYICFTDQPFRHPQWRCIKADPNGISDPRRVARRYKILSHLYFPAHPTIWMDGRVRLNMTPTQMMKKYKKGLVIRRHHARTCIYAEAAEVDRINYEDAGTLNSHVAWLKSQGYPLENGLHETGCIIRRQGDEVVRFNEKWWAALSVYSKRDQLSCDWAAWKAGIKIHSMDRNDITVFKHLKKTNATF